MDNIVHKYNRTLITIFIFSPLLAYISLGILDVDFKTLLQFLSYIGVILIFVFRKKNHAIKFPKYLLFYLLFILYVYHSAFFQLDREFKMIYLFKNGLIGGFNMMLIIENLSIPKKYFDFLIKWCIAGLVIAVMVIVLQQGYDTSLFMQPGAALTFSKGGGGAGGSEDRLHSIYSWLGSLSNGLAFVPIFLMVVEHLYRKKKNILLLIIAGISYALLTKGRWIMVNTMLVFFILIVNQKSKVKHFFKYLFIVPIIMFGSYTALNFAGIDVEDIVVNRVLELNDSADQKSSTTRLLAFEVFDKLYWKNAVFGVGNHKYGMGMGDRATHNYDLRVALAGRSAQIHVGYLALFYRYGLVGGVMFVTFLILLLKKLYKNAKKTTYWGPFFGILGFALANFTLVSFEIYEMGLIIVLVADKYYSQKATKKLL